MSLKYLQGLGLHHLPGQPVPMPGHPFWEQILPDIQPEPPQCHLTSYQLSPREETNTFLSSILLSGDCKFLGEVGTLSKSPHCTMCKPALSPACRACLPGPGIFQCSETGLAFEVESAASIVYRYADWSTHLKEADQNLWVPAGPLFNIWALPGTVRAVYLPHFICVSDVDTSGCSIAHFEFEKMTIQQPKKVMAFTAVLENPSFSLLGVVWRKLRSAISLPVHSLVLIFQQLSAANTTLHLYLIPDDISLLWVSSSALGSFPYYLIRISLVSAPAHCLISSLYTSKRLCLFFNPTSHF
uniref:FIIND domain-containing protein n=1 Tax=Coturnix japonica TaxID=93934 RepID=A0A8C2YDA3_COTJA